MIMSILSTSCDPCDSQMLWSEKNTISIYFAHSVEILSRNECMACVNMN